MDDQTTGNGACGGARALAAQDLPPVERINPQGASPIVLTCEHAGRAVPHRLGDLGIEAADMGRHIAYDVGAEALSRELSRRLDAPLFLQRYSRLVIDCNRPREAPDCIVDSSDGTPIPANRGLSQSDRLARYREIHVPYHAAIEGFLDARREARRPAVVVSVHSFTPVMRATGEARRCQLGLLFNRDPGFSLDLLAAFQRANPGIVAALNEPYTVSDLSDYTIPVHGERRGLPHVLLEVRSDGIETREGQARWADMLVPSLQTALAAISTECFPCSI